MSLGCPIAFVAAHSCAKCERMNGAPGDDETVAKMGHPDVGHPRMVFPTHDDETVMNGPPGDVRD